LNLARPLEPKLIPVKAELALREIQNLFGPQLDQQCSKLNLEPPGDVGFRADPQQLKHIRINVVHNAGDSNQRDGSITLRVRQGRVSLKGRCALIIEVGDNSPGITADCQWCPGLSTGTAKLSGKRAANWTSRAGRKR